MKTSSITLGLSMNWEAEALVILKKYEGKFGRRLPALELRSRALQKLAQTPIASRLHLSVLLSKIVRQVLVDYGKEQSRHYKHHVYDYAFDWAAPEPALNPFVEERLEEILGEDSPLSEEEKELLGCMLTDPVQFIRQDGQPEQSALGRHFGVAHSTIGRRWTRIREKLIAWEQNPSSPSL